MAMMAQSTEAKNGYAYSHCEWLCDRCHDTAVTHGKRAGEAARLPRGWSKNGRKTLCAPCEGERLRLLTYRAGWMQKRDKQLSDLKARAVRHA